MAFFRMEKLFRKLNVTFDKKIGDSISDIKRKRKPQSGLYVKNVGILLTTNTSTVELQAYPIRSTVMKNKEWPIRKFLKLKQCETFFDDFGWEEGVCLSGAAILIPLVLCFFVGPEKWFWRQAKEETKKPGHGKMPDIFSSVISSTIHNSTLIESPQSPVNPEPKKKSKKKHRKKRRKKNISLAKVRESQIKSKVAATSKTSQKRSQVVSSGVSPRSTVSSAITELRKSLVSLKRSSKLPSRMSLRSSPTDAQ